MLAPTPIRTAVIGAGYLGRFHAQKYARLPQSDLVAVVDTDAETARRVAEETHCRACYDIREILDCVDAVSIVVPTRAHAAVALPLLEAGIHCLVEKPFAETIEQAEAMQKAANASGAMIQVGHLERFNPIWQAAIDRIQRPLFIEAHRLSGFKERGLDVDVVMDLMIHDLDLVLALFRGSPLVDLQAVGVPVLSPNIDIANVRLRFEGGGIANLTASRVSVEPIRKFRVFQPDNYVSIDFGAKTADLVRMETGENGKKTLTGGRVDGKQADALEEEIAAFLRAVRKEGPILVTAEDGTDALALARRILSDIHNNPDLRKLIESAQS